MKLKKAKTILSVIIFLNFIQLFGQNKNQNYAPKLSIISANIHFIYNIKNKSNNSRPDPGSNLVSHVVTYHKSKIFHLNYSFVIRENNANKIAPLDLRFTSASNNETIFHIEKDITEYFINKIYNYKMEVSVQNGGWYTLELGEFILGSEKSLAKNISYVKTQIYLYNNKK